MSFSMGLRKCIGFRFALIEMTCCLARMIQNYEFELLNDETVDPVTYNGQTTFRPDNLKVRVTKRSKQ